MLNINIINKSSFNLPKYETEGSAGMDLIANIEESITLNPMNRVLIPTGLHMSIPKGYEGQIRSRSGLAVRNGIQAHIGTIDSDFRGEVSILLFNLGTDSFTINPGDRIAQIIFAKFEKVNLIEVEVLEETTRGEGGFGHTGV